MDFAYPYIMTPDPDGGGLTVTFPDFPGGAGEIAVVTQGEDADHAAAMAAEALTMGVAFYVKRRRRPPTPIPANGRPVAHLAPLHAAKLALWLACADRLGVTGAGPVDGFTALAAEIGVDEKGFHRLLDFAHASKLPAIAEAAEKLGWRIHVHASPIAAE